MTAIVTTPFRVLNAENFKADVVAGGMYLGIGKSDVWSLTTSDTTDTTAFTPYDTKDNIHEAWKNMLGLKKLTAADISHVVPRHTWKSGDTYVEWDSDQADIYDKAFYIVTSEFKVYKCIYAPAATSTIQPTQTNTAPTAESDSYIWKYMYTISVADAEKFLTTSYMPVKTVSLAYANDAAAESALTESDYAQYLNQKASRDHAQAAGIERLEMTANGNSNYTGKPTVTITGDGTGATTVAADITMSGSGSTQNVASITMAQARKGTDYTVAEVTISGGGGTLATARAVISPQTGHGVDPVQELGGFYTALNTLLTGTEAGDLVVAQDFRQVSLIKKPLNYGTTTVSTATTLRALKYLDLTGSNPTANFVLDAIVTGAGGAKAFITEIDVTNGRLYFHQNSKTGYKAFVNGEAITGVGGGSATLAGTAVVNGEVAYNSGQMIFLENRSPINRSSNQTEDIKVIIEF
jgi:hypothetical protein